MPIATLPSLVPLARADPADVEALLDAAFGVDRRGRTAYRLRAGMSAIPDLSFAAIDQDTLVGSLQSWPVAVGATPLVLVGPVAVAPGRQRSGLGRALMERLIERADATGADPLVLIGDPEYYGRFFGFDDRRTQRWDVPGPVERRRLLARVGTGITLPTYGRLGPRA